MVGISYECLIAAETTSEWRLSHSGAVAARLIVS